MNVTFTDNTDAIRSAFEEGVARALEKCGLLAGAAKKHGARKCCRQARGNSDRASKYHAMAEDELKHAAWLHEMTAGEITELDKVFRPTEELQRRWDDSNARYVERAAWVRRMLEM